MAETESVRAEDARSEEREKRAFDRMVAFSDGVFAIAITLLVLDLRLPDADMTGVRQPLAPLLPKLTPSMFAFALSFVVIGGYWVSHHRLFKYIERTDTRLIWLNLLVLFCVVLLPFPTQIVARYGDTTLGILIYAGAMTITGISLVGLTAYAYSAHLTSPDASERVALIKSSITPGVFALSMLVSLWSPEWATRMWWLVAVGFFVIDPILNSNWRLKDRGAKKERS